MTNSRQESVSNEMHYPSKRDLWIAVVIWATSVVLIAVTIDFIDSPMEPIVKYPLVVACLAMVVLSIWILYSTGYSMNSEKLFARCGPFTTVVSLDTIEAVSPSRSPLASAACSLDRLHIRHKGSQYGLLVSPRDKRAFLEALVDRCPNLTLKGDAIVKNEP